MAQVFVPENPREREQLQGGVSVSDLESDRNANHTHLDGLEPLILS